MPYDIVNDVTTPERFGFQGGIHYKDNVTKQFVGLGDGSSCGGQNPVPCHILTFGVPGCYIACGGPERFDNKSTVKYLQAHPLLTWVPTDNTAMMSVSGTLKISGTTSFMFGRVLYKGYYQVGKIHTPGQFFFNGPSGVIGYSTGFEVLTCGVSTTTTLSTTPVPTTTTTTLGITTTTGPCGKFEIVKL